MKKCAESSTSGASPSAAARRRPAVALEIVEQAADAIPGSPSLKPAITGRLQKKREALTRPALTYAPDEKPKT